MKIAILLFEQADLLDFGGPYEVFLTASRLAARQGEAEPFEVVSVSPGGKTVTAYGGLQVSPQMAIEDCVGIDVLVVPGTIDIDRARQDACLLDAIRSYASTSTAERSLKNQAEPGHDSVIASVCTGAFLLAEVGLLADQSWTTHWEDVALLAERLSPEGARRNVRWVDNGRIVTAAGLSSGIDMALHLVHRFVGLDLAQRTARQIDYVWSAEASIL